MKRRVARFMAKGRRWGCGLLCYAGCAGSPGAMAPPAEPSPPPIAAVPEDPIATPSQAQSDDSPEVAAVLERLQALRGLKRKGPLPLVTLSLEEIRGHVREVLRREMPPRAARGLQDLLLGLGLVPAGFDYGQTVERAVSEGLAGFYDPTRGSMFLREGLDSEARRATLNHELVHALQDQNYGLGALSEWQEGESDRLAALHALAEGDALSAMLDVMLAERGQSALDLDIEAWLARLPQEQDAVPGVVQRSIVAPYADGLRFVHALRRQGGFAAVDSAWQSPPISTEQVIHPEKYRSREAPETVPALVPPVEGWEIDYQEVHGEQAVRIVLEQHLSPDDAKLAASGWAGDRCMVFRNGDQVALGWHLLYDTEGHAGRARAAFQRHVALSFPGASARQLGNGGGCTEHAAGLIATQANARHLVIVVRLGKHTGCGGALGWGSAILAGEAG